jgi:hypothetical protein
MKIAVVFAAALLSGCALIPVQDTTLRNANGSSITCKQVGRGVASYWVGKSVYDDCIAKAQAQGYTLSPAAIPQVSAAPVAPPQASAAPDGSPRVSAAQGVAVVQRDTAQTDTQFYSPMILVAPFPLADRSLWGTGKWTDPEVFRPFRDFRCDGISVVEMMMRGKLQSDGKLKIEVKGGFDSLPGHDKRADMKMELLNGDTLVGVGYSNQLKAPEGKRKNFGFDFYTPAGELQPTTHLRITFTDYDD